MRSVIWFREDLRIHDNTALYHAANHSSSLIALYVIDTEAWNKHDMAACRIEFILRGLTCLSEQLRELNIPLIIQQTKESSQVANNILHVMQTHQARTLYFNRQYEINELRRDKDVETLLASHQLDCNTYDDQLILPPNKVLTQQGHYYRVFTPYKRAWQQYYLRHGATSLLKKPAPMKPCHINPSAVPDALPGIASDIDSSLWPAGEKEALKRLLEFIRSHLPDYAQHRDFPAKEGTSKLSPYLSTGMISPRQCFLAALKANEMEIDTGKQGALTWMNELIWRDFYKQILISVPRISMNKAFQINTDKIIWKTNADHLKAWQTGQTGIPIIDAAMRQLNQTGWMHNRLRMVTAMFLAKNLFLNWRLGEKYFMQHLIDGDLAANNGGWQWSASTGTDAAPYFRIFNPIRQSERFDPDGTFIRRYCPELKELSNRAIHDPHTRTSELAKKNHYPKPIVNLEQTRQYAIQAFKNIASD